MVWNRMDLKNFAKESMRRNFGACVLVAFLLSLILGLDISSTGRLEELNLYVPDGVTVSVKWITLLISILIGNVLTVGCCRFFVENREYQAPVARVFYGFQRGNYANAVWIMFLRDVKIFLWTLLLIIPGIIKTYEYRMVPYIVADQPDIPAGEAFAISREMMMGQKLEAWILDISFFGWWLVASFTCGLAGIFWTVPYVHATNAELYAVLRENWMRSHNMGPSYGTQGETF